MNNYDPDDFVNQLLGGTTPKPSTPTGPSAPASTSTTGRSPGGLEQHLSTGATGHPVTIPEANGSQTSYGLYEGNVPPGTLRSDIAPGGGLRSARGSTPYTPQPRAPYGPFVTGDLAARTIAIGANQTQQQERVDPWSGQRYIQGTDGTWRASGRASATDVQTYVHAFGLPQAASQTPGANLGADIAMSANPGLRQNAGMAGVQGMQRPDQAPTFSSLNGFTLPGLGFGLDNTKAMYTGNGMNSVRLPTPVAQRNYGYDFGPGAVGAKAYGQADIQLPSTGFRVPEGYQAGPSGYSQTGPNGGYFSPIAIPFNITAPTFGPLSQSAPAQIQPNATRGPDGSYFSPVGPGQTQPGGMQTPGGAGALMLNGPQTVNINGGGVGFGYNPTMYGATQNRSLSDDAATRAVQVAQILDKQAQLEAAGMSPLAATEALRREQEISGAGGDYSPFDRYAKGGTVTALPMGKFRPFASGGLVTAKPSVVAPLQTTDEQQRQPNQQQQPTQTPTQAPVQQQAQTQSVYNPSPTPSGDDQNGPAPHDSPTPQSPVGPSNDNPNGMITGSTPGAPTAFHATPPATSNPMSADVLTPYQNALARLAVTQRQRDADANRYRAAGLSAPTSVDTLGDLAPGQLPPGVFYDPSGQIKSRISDIVGLQGDIQKLGSPGTEAEIIAQETPLQNMLNTFGNIEDLNRSISGYGQLDTPENYLTQLSGIDTSTARYNQAKDIQSKLTGLGPVGDSSALNTDIASIQQQMAPYKQVQDLITNRSALAATLQGTDVNSLSQRIAQDTATLGTLQDVRDPYTGAISRGGQDPVTGQWVDEATLRSRIADSQRLLGRWQDLADMDKSIAAADPNGEAVAKLGALQTQLDLKKTALGNAQANQQLASQYQNQLSGLIQPGEDIDAAIGRLQAQRGGIQQSLNDAQKVAQLKSQLGNLQGQVGDNTQAGVQAQLTGLNDALSRSRQLASSTTQLQNLLNLGVPGAGKLPGFARGSVSGIRNSLSGISGSESGIRGNESGIRGTESGIRGGDGMVTGEPIVGVGMQSQQPRFVVGEPQYPGGPPMDERLKITPMNRPSLPGLRRAA